MSLATTNAIPSTSLMQRQPNAAESAAMTIDTVWMMAEKVAESKMFSGLNTPSSVFVLMLICQAEGLHPIEAMRIYDLIEGKPAMKAAAIQAKFLSRGGRIKILRRDAFEARAVFIHPQLCPDGWENAVTMEDLDKRGITRGRDGIKANYKRSPSEMLWARLVSNSIRTVDPGIVVGIPSVEEARDELDVAFETAPKQIAPPAVTTATGEPVEVLEARVPGQVAPGIDKRAFPIVVADAAKAMNDQIVDLLLEANVAEVPVEVTAKKTNNFMANAAIQGSIHPGPMPKDGKEAAIMLGKCYTEHRDWMRNTLVSYLEGQVMQAKAAIVKAVESRPVPTQEVEAETVPFDETATEQAPAEPTTERREPPEAEEPPQVPERKRGGKQQPQQTLLPREPGGDDDPN